MNFRRLAYFVAMADTGSLGKASEVLHIAQSALTRQLRLLEDDVGVPLMVRISKGVELTPAGHSFYESARKLLADHDAAKWRAARAAQGDTGTLRLGISDLYPWHPRFLGTLRAYHLRSPGVAFRMEAVHSGQISARILSDELDVALGYVGALTSDAVLSVTVWMRERLLLAVPDDSALVAHPPARLAELNEHDVVLFPRAQSPHLHELLMRHFHARGFLPRVAHEGQTPNTVLGLVAAGLGSAVVPESAARDLPRGVRALSVPDLDLTIPISVVTRASTQAPVVRRFVELFNLH